jgi:putative tributyrin esterase
MALIDCKFFSETLGMSSSLRVILPETAPRSLRDGGVSRPASGHPTLLLLHGMGDDETVWSRCSLIERYATERGLAVVMPNVHRSFYTNMVHGYRYWDFISLEVLEKARRFFPLARDREHNFVAGNSMGGHAAFKLALHLPEEFAAAAMLSGVADVTEFREARRLDFQLIFGGASAERGSEHDLFYLSELVAQADVSKPRLYQCCGTEDFLLAQNRALNQHLAPLGFDYVYEESPGDHDWRYWDKMIAKTLSWLATSP